MKLTLIALAMNEMTEVSSAAAQVTVKVAAWHGLKVAWLNQETLCCSCLLLLSHNCVHCSLRLLLLRS
jgi:hypothetical protein